MKGGSVGGGGRACVGGELGVGGGARISLLIVVLIEMATSSESVAVAATEHLNPNFQKKSFI